MPRLSSFSLTIRRRTNTLANFTLKLATRRRLTSNWRRCTSSAPLVARSWKICKRRCTPRLQTNKTNGGRHPSACPQSLILEAIVVNSQSILRSHLADAILLAGRLLLAFIFLHEGITLATHFDNTVKAMSATGISAPLVVAVI